MIKQWNEIKNEMHDASGVEGREAYFCWKQHNGVWYPITGHAGIHYVKENEDAKEVSINRRNADDQCQFDFPICVMADNLSYTAKVDLAMKMADSLNEDLWASMGEKF